MGATRPLFWFCGGTPPTTPSHGGFAPLDPPFCPPPWAEGSPAFWVPLVAGVLMGATRSLFQNSGGTSPKPPGRGRSPLHSLCPPSLALGSPGFWGLTATPVPIRGGNFPPSLAGKGVRGLGRKSTPPTTPRHGGFACSGPPLPDLTTSIKAIKI